MLPTYLPQPNAFKPHTTLKDYLDHERTPTGWWHNFPKYAVSLLKAYYGDVARANNEFGFGWVPRIVGDHSQLPMTLAMRRRDPRHVQVGLVWHFGWEGFARGDIANILSAVVGDPNTSIHEGKAFTCNLRRGRREETR